MNHFQNREEMVFTNRIHFWFIRKTMNSLTFGLDLKHAMTRVIMKL